MQEDQIENKYQKFLKINLNIDSNLITEVSFFDKKIERLYGKSNLAKCILSQTECDKLITTTWIIIFLYVYFIYYDKIFFQFWLIFTIFMISLISLKRIYNYTKINFNPMLVLMISVYLNLKCIYCNYKSINPNTYEIQSEIIRTIIYEFIGSQFLSHLILQENSYVSYFQLLMSIISVSICTINSKLKSAYVLDILISICYFLIFRILGKCWEKNKRLIFEEKFNFENILDYSIGLICELSSLHIIKNNDDILITGKDIEILTGDCNSIEKNLEIKKISAKDNNFIHFMQLMVEYKHENRDKSDSIPENLFNKINNLPLPELSNNKIFNMGTFFHKELENVKYYNIIYRKYRLDDERFIDDIIFNDVTKFILNQREIEDEIINRQTSLAKISHEFKTPVISIIGMVESIKDCVFSNDKTSIIKHLEVIENLSKYVIYLTQDIIQYSSKSFINNIKINKETVNAKEVLEFLHGILDCLLKCASDKYNKVKSYLEYDKKIDKILIISDVIRIKQIMLNFLSNSVKFTKSGNITIKAECDMINKNIIFSVSDTGIGISEANKLKLFQDYNMINNTNCNKFGSGLGLSINRSIARNINSKINFTSVFGKGSTFSLILPWFKQNDIIYKNINVKLDEPDTGNECNISDRTEKIDQKKIFLDLSTRGPLDMNEFEYNLDDKDEKIKNSKIDSPDTSVEMEYLKMNHPLFKHIEIGKMKTEKSSRYRPKSHDTNIEKKEDNTDEVISNYQISHLKLNKQKILTVDDNKFILTSMKTTVEKVLKENSKNYEIIACCDGLDILNLIREDQKNGKMIKCIITDENMEFINGSHAIKLLRTLENEGKIIHVPIITCSCYEGEIYRKNALDNGADYIIPKPLEDTDLVNIFKLLNIF